MSKKARVSVIKDNVQKGQAVPKFDKDYQHGHWLDQAMISNGLPVDKTGIIDLPELEVDNKARIKGSTANHTVGSMTIIDILNTPCWEETSFHKKLQNQNQVTIDPIFQEVSDVRLVDMAIDVTQQHLKEGYEDCREQLIEQLNNDYNNKEIKSENGWVIFDGYGHPNSYRMRIPNSAMKKIRSLAGSRDTRKKFFENL